MGETCSYWKKWLLLHSGVQWWREWGIKSSDQSGSGSITADQWSQTCYWVHHHCDRGEWSEWSGPWEWDREELPTQDHHSWSRYIELVIETIRLVYLINTVHVAKSWWTLYYCMVMDLLPLSYSFVSSSQCEVSRFHHCVGDASKAKWRDHRIWNPVLCSRHWTEDHPLQKQGGDLLHSPGSR